MRGIAVSHSSGSTLEHLGQRGRLRGREGRTYVTCFQRTGGDTSKPVVPPSRARLETAVRCVDIAAAFVIARLAYELIQRRKLQRKHPPCPRYPGNTRPLRAWFRWTANMPGEGNIRTSGGAGVRSGMGKRGCRFTGRCPGRGAPTG